MEYLDRVGAGMSIRERNNREFPINEFSKLEWRILRMYFRIGMTYREIQARLRVSSVSIARTVKRAIRYCPKLRRLRRQCSTN